jgi:hypothetical protein
MIRDYKVTSAEVNDSVVMADLITEKNQEEGILASHVSEVAQDTFERTLPPIAELQLGRGFSDKPGFSRIMDDIRIYDKALGKAEISKIRENVANIKKPSE